MKRGRKPKSEKKVETPITNNDISLNDVQEKEVLSSEGQGFLIIALGHPQYGRMAANLAASIKHQSTKPIHLVYSGESISHLTEQHKQLFTTIQECPKEYYTIGNKTVYLKSKTHIYDLSPFAETIFIDADAIFLPNKNLDNLFDEFKGIDFTSENYGKLNIESEKHMWFKPKEAKEAYGIEHDMYEIRSQFMYFKKTESIKQFFDTVKEVFVSPKVKAGREFDGYLPDELAFNIATGLTGIKPHKENYKTIYWVNTDGSKQWGEIMGEFIGYSVGGNRITDTVRNKYKMLAEFFSRSLKLPFAYKIYPKANWNHNRKSI